MLFPTHILLGISIFLVLRDFFSGGNEGIFFLFVLLGSILPDIDAKKSKINRWTGIIGMVVAAISKHRGFFHSLLFYSVLFFVLGYFFNFYYGAALMLGYLAHIIGDGVTLQGVRIFYPFSNFRLRGFVRVGGFTENVILLALFVFIILKLLS